ncbi:hypothetical protein LHYA1_G006065 [Lachnellula hyalina]|uniref:Uncharacterized protein n=1 Tax=Lachnellula hyalina TaxID=1316788 RepID=A0A8H8TZK5_9HELO|nr:uncharacterized protein LHYA1_G006065 [Lachnellula hyalina]TVY25076.1 hypothetical protein LHYA1_G006065 [Lachnellula hyalina]
MADRNRIKDDPYKFNQRRSTATATAPTRRSVDPHPDPDPDSDSGSDSSAKTVIYAPLGQSISANHQSNPQPIVAAAKNAPQASSSSYEVRPPHSTAPPALTARREISPRVPSNFGSRLTEAELESHPVIYSTAFARGGFVEPPPTELSSDALANLGLPVNRSRRTSAHSPASPYQSFPPLAPADTQRFAVLEPILTQPSTGQDSPALRRRTGQVTLTRTNLLIGNNPPYPTQNRASDNRSFPASSGAFSPQSSTTNQNVNFGYPRSPSGPGETLEAFPVFSPPSTSSPASQNTASLPRTRNRTRSNSISRENPLEYPITGEEERLAGLVRSINQDRERDTARNLARQAAVRRNDLQRSGGYRGTTSSRSPLPTPLEPPILRTFDYRGATSSSGQYLLPVADPYDRSTTPTPRSYASGRARAQTTQATFANINNSNTAQFTRTSALQSDFRQPNIRRVGELETLGSSSRSISLGQQSFSAPAEPPSSRQSQSGESTPTTTPKSIADSSNIGDFYSWRVEVPHFSLESARAILQKGYLHDTGTALDRVKVASMNFQSYGENPQGGPSNPRQAPPSPSQGMNHQNGVNGGMGPGAAMIGYPTPVGHQSDLNYVMSMVDELSGVLRMNQQLTANVVDKMGRVREKAKNLNLNNDELIGAAAGELSEESQNLDRDISELRKALEDSEYDKRENFKLAVHGAEILADIAEKVHKFKASHEADTLAWHKNYRKQLADEREENLRLRNEMNDQKAAASRANEHLRAMRRYITDNDERHNLRVENHRLRTEKRFWKRLALPLIPDDDSEWSDDDDLIDPEEKKRLEAALKEKERIAREEVEGEVEGDAGAGAA